MSKVAPRARTATVEELQEDRRRSREAREQRRPLAPDDPTPAPDPAVVADTLHLLIVLGLHQRCGSCGGLMVAMPFCEEHAICGQCAARRARLARQALASYRRGQT
ncbi:MAG: hypothetical protein WCG85_02365 [Polyangia bacterium]